MVRRKTTEEAEVVTVKLRWDFAQVLQAILQKAEERPQDLNTDDKVGIGILQLAIRDGMVRKIRGD